MIRVYRMLSEHRCHPKRLLPDNCCTVYRVITDCCPAVQPQDIYKFAAQYFKELHASSAPHTQPEVLADDAANLQATILRTDPVHIYKLRLTPIHQLTCDTESSDLQNTSWMRTDPTVDSCPELL